MTAWIQKCMQIPRNMPWTALLAALLPLLGLEWRAVVAARESRVDAVARLEGMRKDAMAIQALRVAPISVAARSRPNHELLAQVEAALTAAGIDRGLWHDSVPLAPRRTERGDYKRYGVRLHVDAVTLRQVVEFAVRLQAIDSTLQLTGLALINRNPDTEAYDTEFEIAYRVFAPDRTGASPRPEKGLEVDPSRG